MWRGLTRPDGILFDPSPPDTLPGLQAVPLAGTLNATSPWLTTPTHWAASAWDLPSFTELLATLKAGNIPTRDWLPFNLTQARARTAGQSLYARTVDWDPNGTLTTAEVAQANIAAGLAANGLQRIPSQPLG